MLLPTPAVATGAASGKQTPAVARFLPSLTDVAFLMPVMFLFIKLQGAQSLLSDGDTGWHIRTGEWILAHHRVPLTDMFSFSRPGQPWFAWEWLSDVWFAALHQRWGMAGVVLMALAVLCVTNAMLFRLTRRKCDNGLVAIAVTLLATGGCAIHWLARPHIFTLLFFTITLHIAERAAEGRTKLLRWLPPITLLWTNLHGGFFVLFLVLGCYIGSNLLNAAIERDSLRRLEFLRAAKPWAMTALACFAVTFINPYGWRLHQHIVEYITDPYQLQHITEFQGMNFHSPVVVYFEPLMVGALVTALWDAWNRRFADVFLGLGWLHLALIAQRNLPLFAIAASPLVARAIVTGIESLKTAPLADWLRSSANWFTQSCVSFEETDRIGRVHLASVLPVAVVGLLLFAPRPVSAKFNAKFDPKSFPEGALKLLRGPDTQRIFAEDQWGDYLIYHLYPTRQVFIDGRSDFYGAKFGLSYLDLIGVKYDWQKTLDQYAIDTIVIAPRFALASALKLSHDWRVVYDDSHSIVFRRNRAEKVSLVSSDAGKDRDRAIAKPVVSDLHGLKHGEIPTT
jgi:hypothetical protein